MYVSHSKGANFWLGVLTDLQNRGVKDILIACVDGLSGFPDAIQSVFPNTDVQLCIVHQIRNSLKYVGSKNHKEFLKDLKLVYAADTKEKAETELDHLEDKWGELYPIVIKSWRDKWEMNNDALYELVYLTYRNLRKKWTMPLANWGQTAQQLAIKFEDRFKIM